MPSAQPTSPISRLARIGALATVVAIASLGWATPVEAHSFLVRTSPAGGSRLTASPDDIVLDFSEPIDGTPRVTLRTTAGQPVDLAVVRTDAGKTRVRANVPTLARDVYVVTWQVPARDGHSTEGEFAFAVGTDLPAGTSRTTTQPSTGPFPWVDALTQFEVVAGLAFAFGGLASEGVIWKSRPLGPSTRRSPATLSIALALVGVLSAVAVELHRRQALFTPAGWSNVLDTRADRLLLAIGGISVLTLVAVRASRLRRHAALLVAAALALIVWRGHSGDDTRWWATPIGTAHLIGGAIWAGALLHLTRAAIDAGPAQPEIAAAARRYSLYALLLVPATIGVGTITALTRFAHLAELWTTRYGQILLVKLALVAAALALANLARTKGLLALDRRSTTLRTITRIELAAVTAVVAASVALATTAPPTSASTFVLGPPPIPNATWSADLAGNNLVLVAAVDHQLHVRVLQPGGQPPAHGRATIDGRQPDGSDIDITARTCGLGCEIVNHDWHNGTTALTITVGDSDYAGGTAHVTIAWPPGPDGTALLAAAVAVTRAEPRIALTESVTSDSSTPADTAATQISGPDFISQEPFANGGDDIHQLADDNGLNVITLTVPASNIWVQMWIDPTTRRILKETIIDPGHRIEHTLTYSA